MYYTRFTHLVSQLCREQFVALHNSPILDNLAKEFEEKFGHFKYVNCVSVYIYLSLCVVYACAHVCVQCI